MDISQLLKQAKYWLSIDPDQTTRTELAGLLERVEAGEPEAQADLADRFSGTLQFGTAGLRAEMGAGPMRMNRVVVRRAAAGLAAYINSRALAEGWEMPSAVVGFDARFNSHIFARETAAIFEAAGITTRLMPKALPTPVLAWATRAYGAEAGVMVTASHNPPADNGYKVYLGGQALAEEAAGAQIVPPYDSEIAAAIAAVDDDAIELAEGGWQVLTDSVEDDYLNSVLALTDRFDAHRRDLKIVYTAMHGVGGQTVAKVMERAGFKNFFAVAEQFEPNPFFPTVSFPNPEEPGALDLAFKVAEREGADLLIANDPDADRAAFAVPDSARGSWRQLSGNEVGTLLGYAVIKTLGDISALEPQPVFANSVVSSRQLGVLARAAGVQHRQTLTGFKWIARIPNLVFGFEEAIGYAVDPASVKDKDGVSAALFMALFAQQLAADGSSLLAVLDEIERAHGVYATEQVSIRVEDLSQISAMMEAIAANPPASLAGSPVEQVYRMEEGSDELPPTTGMMLTAADSSRVIVRPSGTEPKLKCYLEVIRPVGEGQEALELARQQAKTALAEIAGEVRGALGLKN